MTRDLFPTALFTATVFIGLAVLFLAVSRPAQATPQYAQQTGMACGSCHVSPSGGGTLKPFGKQFQANGHKLPGKK